MISGRNYDDDQRASLIKMEIPYYPEDRSASLRVARFVIFATILGLLGYSLWRIQVIESALEASDRFANITRLINTSSRRRTERSVDYNMDKNSLDGFDKPKRPRNKDEFDRLVNDLYDKIQAMHNETDRSNFDRNIKAVFAAWFPVFDALLRHEMSIEERARMMVPNEVVRQTRSVADGWKSRGIKQYAEESSEEKPRRSSEEEDDKRSNKKKKKKSKKSSEESEEKPRRYTRSAESSEERESSEEKENNDIVFGEKHYYKHKIGDESAGSESESKESREKDKEKFYYHVVV